jgi:hypothetical protein
MAPAASDTPRRGRKPSAFFREDDGFFEGSPFRLGGGDHRDDIPTRGFYFIQDLIRSGPEITGKNENLFYFNVLHIRSHMHTTGAVFDLP